MDRESLARLRLDRRLTGRRGWIAPEELAQELESLPDAADKIADPIAEEPAPEPGPRQPGAGPA